MTPRWLKQLPVKMRHSLVTRPGAAAFIGNSGWLLFDKLVRMVLGVLVGAWVARYLGPGRYGQLSYAAAYIAVFVSIANLGADGITVRDITRAPAATPEILGTATIVRAVVGVMCLIAAVGCAVILSRRESFQVLLIAIVGGTLLFQACDTVDLWFQSQSQSRRTVSSKLIAYLISNGAKVILIFAQAPLVAFAVLLLFDSASAAVALAIAYRRFPAHRSWQFDRGRARQLLMDSRPFMFGGFLIVLYLRVDQILIKQLLGERDLGMYASAVWLLQIWQVIPATLSISLGPFIARRKSQNEAVYRSTLVLVFRVFFYTGLAGTFVTFFIAPQVVHVFYGDAYREAIPIMRFYAATLPCYFLSMAHNLWLINEGKYSVRVYGAVVASILTVAVIYLTYRNLGSLSGCVAAILSQFVALLLINAVLDKEAFRMQLQAIMLR